MEFLLAEQRNSHDWQLATAAAYTAAVKVTKLRVVGPALNSTTRREAPKSDRWTLVSDDEPCGGDPSLEMWGRQTERVEFGGWTSVTDDRVRLAKFCVRAMSDTLPLAAWKAPAAAERRNAIGRKGSPLAVRRSVLR